ncbi:unnamed protein product [Calypogeia fissa]
MPLAGSLNQVVDQLYRLGLPRLPERPMPIVKLEEVDQQLQSPLYDGTIPPDIRKIIFDDAMAEYVDPNALYPTNTDYTRPDFLGKKKVSINLLLMCKRSYLETRHVPPVNKTHAFWHERGPPDELYSDDELGYFHRFTPDQLALVKEIHLFTQQWWLEDNFGYLRNVDALQRVIEKVKITLRRGDWWWNEDNAELEISPQGGDVSLMKEDWSREKAGEVVEWDPDSWGSVFMNFKALKELEMELETYEYKEAELDEIVRHAVMWKFPMGNGQVLSCEEGLRGVKKSSWRGPPCGWYQCPKCAGQNEECKFCEEMELLISEEKGPMLILRSLRWKLTDAK